IVHLKQMERLGEARVNTERTLPMDSISLSAFAGRRLTVSAISKRRIREHVRAVRCNVRGRGRRVLRGLRLRQGTELRGISRLVPLGGVHTAVGDADRETAGFGENARELPSAEDPVEQLVVRVQECFALSERKIDKTQAADDLRSVIVAYRL